jgi:maltooligosyltrehalose trehalohydrolase
LNKAVREGRRREFKSFAAFADDTSKIPDPTEEETFLRSKLDWSERERSPHREVLADTTHLLALRREVVVPLAKSGIRGAAAHLPRPDVVDCTWTFASGLLRFVANFGDAPFPVEADGARTVWTNAPDGKAASLPSWTGVVLTESRS